MTITRRSKDKATRVPRWIQKSWPLAAVFVVLSGLWLTEIVRRNRQEPDR